MLYIIYFNKFCSVSILIILYIAVIQLKTDKDRNRVEIVSSDNASSRIGES